MTWQGLLHGAQNATRTALLDCKTCESKFDSPTNLRLKLVWVGFMFSTGFVAAAHLAQSAVPIAVECANATRLRHLWNYFSSRTRFEEIERDEESNLFVWTNRLPGGSLRRMEPNER